MSRTPRLVVTDRDSPESYATTFALQEQLVAERIADRSKADTVIFVEHEDVYTCGRGTPPQMIVGEVPRPAQWIEVNRGGKATYHGPGQLVAYPIFDLERHGQDVHIFLRNLEEVTIRALRLLGVQGYRRPELTGVWVTSVDGAAKKIASIGIGVRKWITYHGLALNVETDMRYFRAISPCGQAGDSMTSLKEVCEEQGEPVPSMEEVKSFLAGAFEEVFGLTIALEESNVVSRHRPKWLKVAAPGSDGFKATNEIIRQERLVTVCEEAMCPNISECWSHSTATFMIMGDLCTRRCSFCSVKDGTMTSLEPLSPFEPVGVAQAIQRLGLNHVVITSVNRDDLDDMGAEHFHRTIKAIATLNPNCAVELLIPDMRGNEHLVRQILRSGLVRVLNHNVETVPRLYKRVRPGAIFERSLAVLRAAKELGGDLKTKSGLMVGLGERYEEVIDVMKALRDAGCDILTIGQYLQPTAKQLPVERFVTPQEFARYREAGLSFGFSHVESGPLVRSSYHAWKHVSEASSQPLNERRGTL